MEVTDYENTSPELNSIKGTLRLSKPIDIDGNETQKIDYDFDRLTGHSIEKAVKSLMKEHHMVVVQEADSCLHAYLFAEAAGIDVSDVRRLKAKDYGKATVLVRNFLSMDAEDSQQ